MMFVFTMADVLTLIVIAIIVTVYTIHEMKIWFKQQRCEHEKYFETQACDAICSNCGKNLGFIGKVREKRK